MTAAAMCRRSPTLFPICESPMAVGGIVNLLAGSSASPANATGAIKHANSQGSVRSLKLLDGRCRCLRGSLWLLRGEFRGWNKSKRRGAVCEVVVQTGEDAQSCEYKAGPGSKVKVTVPLKVYHLPKIPEFDLEGLVGEVKDVLRIWKGKPISANLPFKVQFLVDVAGKQVKFFAHLKEDEFTIIE